MRNQRRIKRVTDALKGGKYALGPDTEDSVTDILADLQHFCTAKGIDFNNQLRVARDHVSIETGA
jgi:hypothetical protein